MAKGIADFNQTESLCWNCLRSYNGCPWSRGFKSIPGWRVEKIESAYYSKCIRVKKCPLFIKEEWVIEDGVKKRKIPIPDEWKVFVKRGKPSDFHFKHPKNNRNHILFPKIRITDEDRKFLRQERKRQKEIMKKIKKGEL